jgi:antitoxin component YwqK of YwqJK toxin-antitoxin module
MISKIIISLLISSTVINASAQSADTLNITDSKGLKQGHWIKKNPKGTIIYDGFFINDKPTGTFKRYYEDGKLQSVLVFSRDGMTADAVFYHPNGLKSSQGKYINQMKEGKWQFFSALSQDYLICEEEYLHNSKNGLSVKYYPDRTPSEKVTYSNDVRTGEWTQYYPNGQVCLTANYADGKLQGKYIIYYENGKPQFSGQYRDDARDGIWLKFNYDGTVKTRIDYIMGLATNPELYRRETEYLDSLERNKGKIPDPEKTGVLW